MIVSKENYKILEFYLRKYETLKILVQAQKEDIINSSNSEGFGIGGGSSSTHSDITANKAIKLLKKTKEEKWVDSIELLIKKLSGTNKHKFLIEVYFKDRTIKEVLEIMNIEQSTAYYFRENILNYFFMIALQNGLMKVKE